MAIVSAHGSPVVPPPPPGAAVATAIVAEVSVLLRNNAQRIVACVMSSSITAIAMLVRSLRIVTQIAVG
jgi:hypothetical protein